MHQFYGTSRCYIKRWKMTIINNLHWKSFYLTLSQFPIKYPLTKQVAVHKKMWTMGNKRRTFNLILHQWLGRFLGITGWDPSICKSNWLHVDILPFFFIKLGYILQIPYKWSLIIMQSWISTGYFSNSIGSSVTNCRFSPIIILHVCWQNAWNTHLLYPIPHTSDFVEGLSM